MHKYIIEFIGTFFLTLTVALTGNPLAIGGILIAMVYMGGSISGAHFNPAVTLAILLRGNISQKDSIKYILAQVVGATVAGITFLTVKGDIFIPKSSPDTSISLLILLETLFTFILTFVVLQVTTSEKTKGNQYFGLAIGLTVMAGAFAVGPITGGVFNPAIILGTTLVDINHLSNNLTNLVIYLLSQFTGGALAAYLYRSLR